MNEHNERRGRIRVTDRGLEISEEGGAYKPYEPVLTHYYKDSRPLCDQDGTDTSPFTGSLNLDLVTCLDCLRLLARRADAWEPVVRVAEVAAAECRTGGPLYMLSVLRTLQHVPNKWRFAEGLVDGDECEADSWEPRAQKGKTGKIRVTENGLEISEEGGAYKPYDPDAHVASRERGAGPCCVPSGSTSSVQCRLSLERAEALLGAIRSESEVRAKERDAEWGRIYSTLANAGFDDAACYLEDLSDPEYAPATLVRGCYYTRCDSACSICQEYPAVVCKQCVQFRRQARRDELRAEGAAKEQERCACLARERASANSGLSNARTELEKLAKAIEREQERREEIEI